MAFPLYKSLGSRGAIRRLLGLPGGLGYTTWLELKPYWIGFDTAANRLEVKTLPDCSRLLRVIFLDFPNESEFLNIIKIRYKLQ